MSTPFFEFPTHEDWKRIYEASPFEAIFSRMDVFQAKKHMGDGLEGALKAIEVDSLIYETQQRLGDVGRSFILMMFYYEKGIPDKRWYVSPGSRGGSIEYFPDFEKQHFAIKGWFDFYSDTLYYKLFSSWDLIGHILNIKYDLEIDRIYFRTTVKALEGKEPTMYAKLTSILNSPVYQSASRIRNDITHNYLPNTTGMAISRDGRAISIGLKKYVPSDEIVNNIQQTLDLFALTLQHISA